MPNIFYLYITRILTDKTSPLGKLSSSSWLLAALSAIFFVSCENWKGLVLLAPPYLSSHGRLTLFYRVKFKLATNEMLTSPRGCLVFCHVILFLCRFEMVCISLKHDISIVFLRGIWRHLWQFFLKKIFSRIIRLIQSDNLFKVDSKLLQIYLLIKLLATFNTSIIYFT